MTPTSLSLRLLRQEGFTATVCESWIPHANLRRDLFGFGDIIGAHPRERRILLVQATSAGHVADRLAKARAIPELTCWLRSGGEFEVWGWRLVDGRWQVRRVAVLADDLAPVVLSTISRRRRPGERRTAA